MVTRSVQAGENIKLRIYEENAKKKKYQSNLLFYIYPEIKTKKGEKGKIWDRVPLRCLLKGEKVVNK